MVYYTGMGKPLDIVWLNRMIDHWIFRTGERANRYEDSNHTAACH